MFIANPLYDVVFKYMMEDNEVAKLFVSTIIGETIVELDFSPKEYVFKIDIDNKIYTVYHLDFLAKIKTPNGFRSVIIEVQKAKLPTDIMRFRRYLGGQYQNESNYFINSKGKQKAMQIYCIFFLGDGLGMKNVPVLEIDHQIKDLATQKEVKDWKNDFINGLHHHSWIVQVPELPKYRRNKLEKLLAIFDQSNCTGSDRHLLSLPEKDIPKEFANIWKRLSKAAQNEDIKNQMAVEDFYIENFKINERIIEAQKKQLIEKDNVIFEKEKALSEKDHVISEKDHVILEKDKALATAFAEIEKLKRKIEEESD